LLTTLQPRLIDKLILQCDAILRKTQSNSNVQSLTPSPALAIPNDCRLSKSERYTTIALMRVNHSGEVCAQALYLGQALMAKSPQQYESLMEAAAEENDHLLWCQGRLTDLQGRTSLLNPFWFAGSYGIGILAGLGGDKISLGFVAETERQVTQHLENDLTRLPQNDYKTRAILVKMRDDEMEHATFAEQAGATELPLFFKKVMRFTAKVLTVVAARV
jgi:ubiquinone biosynthesis monooxygenase Coq7